MAVCSHVQVLVNSVCRERHGRGRAAGKDIGILYELDHVGFVATACTFDVIHMDGSTLECSGGVLDESGLVEGIGVDMTLDILFLANTTIGQSVSNPKKYTTHWIVRSKQPQASFDCRWRTAKVLVELQGDHTGVDLIVEPRLSGIAALSDDAVVHGQLIARLHHLSDVSFASAAIHGLRGRAKRIISY